MNYRAVTIGDKATLLNADPDDTVTDYYLSFQVQFADLVSYLGTSKSINIDHSSPLRYILATSTQDNSLNQDLGAVPKLTKQDESRTWDDLGGLTTPITAAGVVIPEPSSGLLVMMGVLSVVLRRRR